MPRRSTILKRERAAKAPKAAPKLPIKLVAKPIVKTEPEEIAEFLRGLARALLADMEESDHAPEEWRKAIKLVGKKADRLCRLVYKERIRHLVDTEVRRRAVSCDLLDREACHTATIEAIASTDDSWKVRVQKALRSVQVLNGGLNQSVENLNTTIPGDPTAAKQVSEFRNARPAADPADPGH